MGKMLGDRLAASASKSAVRGSRQKLARMGVNITEAVQEVRTGGACKQVVCVEVHGCPIAPCPLLGDPPACAPPPTHTHTHTHTCRPS